MVLVVVRKYHLTKINTTIMAFTLINSIYLAFSFEAYIQPRHRYAHSFINR